MVRSVTIARRFRGPPESGNGGYSCGVVGTLLDGPAEVTLRLPPPLDRPLDVERDASGVRVRSGDELVAEAKPSRVDLVPPAAPSFAEAADAAKRFPWYTGHPYPSCFVCGPERTPGDGLCIHPGAIPERNVAAAPFLLDASIVDANGRLRPEIAWAALDCPSWFGFDCFHAFEGRILLGRLTARIDDLPRLGDRCIAGGWFLERDGRKIHCGSAIWSESGAVLAVARATWITLK